MKFNSILAQYKFQNTFPHALLLQCNGCIDYNLIIKNYLKSLICHEQIFCDKCIYCQKINQDAYVDLIVIDCSVHQLNRDDVNNIQKNFIISGIEKTDIKLYAIINIENANKAAINSLLKFLEEPPKNTYALFFCRNQEMVLKTISSRCQCITITNENLFEDSFINNCFDSKSEYEKFISKYNVQDEINLIQKIINHDIETLIEFNKKFKNMDYEDIAIYLNIISFYLSIEKRIAIKELKQLLHLNFSKASLLNKIFDILEK